MTKTHAILQLLEELRFAPNGLALIYVQEKFLLNDRTLRRYLQHLREIDINIQKEKIRDQVKLVLIQERTQDYLESMKDQIQELSNQCVQLQLSLNWEQEKSQKLEILTDRLRRENTHMESK